MNAHVERVRRLNDQYSALLRDSLAILPGETIDNCIVELEKIVADVDETSDMSEVFEANAALVGIVTVMLATIDADTEGEVDDA